MSDFQIPEFGKVEMCGIRLRQLPELQPFNVAEIALSYPVFSLESDGVFCIHYFHYPSVLLSTSRLQIGRPLSHIILEPEVFVLRQVLIADAAFPGLSDAFPIQKFLEPDKVPIVPLLVQEMYGYYDTFTTWFPNQPSGKLGERFRLLFTELVNQSLLPFYEALNPAFFEWLN